MACFICRGPVRMCSTLHPLHQLQLQHFYFPPLNLPWYLLSFSRIFVQRLAIHLQRRVERRQLHELPSKLVQRLLDHILGDMLIGRLPEHLPDPIVCIGACPKQDYRLIRFGAHQEVLQRLGALPNSGDQDTCRQRIESSSVANLDLDSLVSPSLSLIGLLAGAIVLLELNPRGEQLRGVEVFLQVAQDLS